MSDRRVNNRNSYYADIKLEIDTGSIQVGIVTEISTKSALVTTDPLPDLGSEVMLHINVPGLPNPCAIPCVVHRTVKDQGVRLQFEHLHPMEIWALNRLERAIVGENKPN